MRTIDTEHNWFWQQGYHDGLDGLRAIAPDETRHAFQRSDYFVGYGAGQEDRSTHDSPRYEFAHCLKCGQRYQLIEFGGNPHAAYCDGQPNPAEIDAAYLRHGYVLDSVWPLGDRHYKPGL
jgi:hypothetical protein